MPEEFDPWRWLLDRTERGLWRHVPFQAARPGQGQDPAQEPRVEVIRRLIAYPEAAFAHVVEAVSRVDRPREPVRWLCYREAGERPARPYWVCFVTTTASGQRRFRVGLELFDRHRLGLWFFSGYAPGSLPPELAAPFPSRPDLLLPRLELTETDLQSVPLDSWLTAAWEDRLSFRSDPTTGRLTPVTPANPPSSGGSADQSHVLDASLLALPEGADLHLVGLRASRARLVMCHEEGEIGLHPLARLVTTIGRDPRCELVLEDRRVSSEHARISFRDGRPVLEDLGSKNGTRLDGSSLVAGTLYPLDEEAVIDLGGLRCLFIRDEPGAEDTHLDRQELRLQSLVKAGQLPAEETTQAVREARERGLTPVEVLLARRQLELSLYVGKLGPRGSCVALLLLVGLSFASLLLAWWRFLPAA